MRFGSLFAGVGGFDIGLEAAGWECAWQVEWDKNCQEVLSYHWPDVPKWWDVADVNGADLPSVDVVTFGSPCQDLSVAGRRAGLDGSRSNLFFEATRIIREMQNATGGTFPRYAIWENVVGALNSRGGDDFEAVLREMADLGAYHLEWAVLDAQFFGVPQRRRRVFVIACLDSSASRGSGQQILAVGEGRRRNPAKGKSKGQGASSATPDGVGSGSTGHRLRAFGDYVDDDCASSINQRDYKYATDLVVEPALSFDSNFGGQSGVYDDVAPHVKVGSGVGISSPPAVLDPQERERERERDGRDRQGSLQPGRECDLSADHRGERDHAELGGERPPRNWSGILGSDIVGPLAASDYKFPQQQQVMENKIVVVHETSPHTNID